jgi:hypothetical protein
MSYIEDVDRELRELVRQGTYYAPEKAYLLTIPQIETIATFVKNKVATSYKNGMQATARIKEAKARVGR